MGFSQCHKLTTPQSEHHRYIGAMYKSPCSSHEITAGSSIVHPIREAHCLWIKSHQSLPCSTGGWTATPLKNMSERQLGWWHSKYIYIYIYIYMYVYICMYEKNKPFMFQSTNQMIVHSDQKISPLKSLLKIITVKPIMHPISSEW